MAKREKLGGVFRNDEGTLKKGGVNERYETLERPPDPPAMKPSKAPETTPATKPPKK